MEEILGQIEEPVYEDRAENLEWAGKSEWSETSWSERLPDNFTPVDDDVQFVHIGSDEYPATEEDINALEEEFMATFNNGEHCHCEESCGDECSCAGDDACSCCHGEHQSFSGQDGIAQLDYDESDFEQIASRPIFLPEKHGTKKVYRANKVKAKRDMAKKSQKVNRGKK